MKRLCAFAAWAVIATCAMAQAPVEDSPQPQQRRSPFTYPPISVAPPVIEVPRSVTAPAPVVVAPPLQVQQPTVITSCDAGGCWDSSGRRLNSVGPQLVGPGGPCQAQAGVVHCP